MNKDTELKSLQHQIDELKRHDATIASKKSDKGWKIAFIITLVLLILVIVGTSSYAYYFVKNTQKHYSDLYSEKEKLRVELSNNQNELKQLKADYQSLLKSYDAINKIPSNANGSNSSTNYTPQSTSSTTNCNPTFFGGFSCFTY